MSFGSSKQESTQTSEPPSWAKPLFTTSAKDALNLYNSGQGGNVYQGQRVTDLNGTTTGAVNKLTGAADMYNSDAVNKLATGDTSSAMNLANMANGSMIGNNTAFNEALQNTLNNTATTINSSMSGAGRYGSGAHSGVMSNQLGQVATNAMANQYNQDVTNMMNANSQIDSANLGKLSGLNSLYQGYSNAAGNQLAGGQVLDQNAQNKLDAERDKFAETDNQGWTRLGLLQSAAAGAAGNYGTTTGSQKSSSKGMNLLSDIRTKENIVPVGERNGFKLYEWNYRGLTKRWRGVMAQDLLEVKPEAVTQGADGLYRVDYSQLGFEMEAA
ncbi:tail fiber domain-containing protein [Ochrobactrum chromiisoli]|uniref:Tail fiber domain-containing protein n=1 Tax=Ochrobactrum chromiisoli TaxID=2993941 RepID=A0ABT3QUG9_9HYPH|nr:tail fiber domain-containing protein [Ochrobactrum chromiisoli]MCX2699282.1 tail fiber domain-containing protein [Ochrobactrum chromiisoli]